MKRIAAGAFKAKCLAIIDEVQAKREPALITKYGKPVVKVVSVEHEKDNIFGFLKGKVVFVGDVVSPALTKEEWGNLWPEDDDK